MTGNVEKNVPNLFPVVFYNVSGCLACISMCLGTVVSLLLQTVVRLGKTWYTQQIIVFLAFYSVSLCLSVFSILPCVSAPPPVTVTGQKYIFTCCDQLSVMCYFNRKCFLCVFMHVSTCVSSSGQPRKFRPGLYNRAEIVFSVAQHWATKKTFDVFFVAQLGIKKNIVPET